MKYGLPYKGSKNKLAERIVRLLPKRTNLVDLFCGGCAVSHAALVMGKYEHIHINDLNWMAPTLFIDALNGKYNNDTRWISREDFFRLRDTDPYVAVVWSFGNNLRDYLYSQEIEPLKKAIHYAIFFSDYSLGKALGHDLSFIDPIKDVQRRYVAVKRYFSQYGHFQQQSLEGGVRCKSNTMLGQQDSTLFGGGKVQLQSWCMGGQRLRDFRVPKQYAGSTPTSSHSGGASASVRLEATERRLNISRNITLSKGQWGGVLNRQNKRPSELQHTECINRVSAIKKKNMQATLGSRAPRASQQHCTGFSIGSVSTVCQPSGGQNLPITSSVLDYAEVEIPKDSVIYCDIPYEGTNVYNGAEHFDYERFYEWAERQTEPVFISSYQMPPDRFDCIQEWSHRSTLNDRVNNAVTERIFVPRHQAERGNIVKQLSLDLFSE